MPIWPFNKKTAPQTGPKLQDEALGDLSRMFLNNPEDPTPGEGKRDPIQFDFTVDSLKAMDAHLEEMRVQELDGQAWNSFILRAGVYVGEVIRRHTPEPKQWH